LDCRNLFGVRYLGVDYGARRIGLAVSDETATLARPWQVVTAGTDLQASARQVAALVATAASGIDPLRFAGVVLGLPRRLNGEDNEQTPHVRIFASALQAATGLPVHLQDERLSSLEAEARLGVRERDWRRRKARLDAAAAAVILQDFLDARARGLETRGLDGDP
jgi:putative Holliday junction resolvase